MKTPQLCILSLLYRNEIESICKNLSFLDFSNFVMYIIFNNGHQFILSNLFSAAEEYYKTGLFKEDFSCRSDIIDSVDYYLCKEKNAISPKLRLLFENNFSIYRVYNLVRRSPECIFVFSAIRNKKFSDGYQIYMNTKGEFENFCINFIEKLLHVIIKYNPDYRNSFILNNNQYRRAVIKGNYFDKQPLTMREKECLRLGSKGKSAKEIARDLNISYLTVETHIKRIKEKLNCKTMVEAVLEGMHRNIIGTMNPWIKDSSESLDRILVKNMPIPEITNISILNQN